MSHKPAGLVYGVDDTPPLGVNILSGLQHVGLMSIYLVYPVLVAQAAGASPEVAASLVSATLIALAVATLLQVVTIGPIGSGFLCQPTSSVVYTAAQQSADWGTPLAPGASLDVRIAQIGQAFGAGAAPITTLWF